MGARRLGRAGVALHLAAQRRQHHHRPDEQHRAFASACLRSEGGREILILGHTDCLVRKTGTLELLGKFAALGIERARMPENLQEYFGLFASERQNVLKAVEHVRASPLIGPRVPVHGALVDIATGRLELLVNGYQALSVATSSASAVMAKGSEAISGGALALPSAESKKSLPLAEIKFPQFKIGEGMARVEATLGEMSAPTADKPHPAKPPPVPAADIPNLKRLVDLARHYRIIGGDGKHYGPVPATVLLRWITDGRIDAETSVQVEGSSAWVKLHQLGEALHRLGARRK